MLSLWGCGQGVSLVHHIHGPPSAVGLGRGLVSESRVGSLGVVELDPVPDDLFGPEAVGQLMQVDRLVFERPPEAFDEDVV